MLAKTNSKYDELERDVVQLQQSMQIMHDLVYSQKESIDSLEDSIEETFQKVEKAEQDLKEGENIRENTNKISYISGISVTLLTIVLYVFF
jgi:t-SNARE complex subunit (syntaxin)